MANIKISELPAITTPLAADLVPVVQAGVTDQITRGNFLKNVDADSTLTDITTNNASTTKHGFAPKATAPAAGIRSVLAIDNAETVYKVTPLLDDTNPAALGTAGPGTSLIAARRDHVHSGSGLTATDSDAIHDNVSGEIVLVTEKTTPVAADLVLIEDSASSNAKKRVQLSNLPAPGSDTQVLFNDSGKLGGDGGLTYNKTTDTLTIVKAVMSVGADVGIAATTMSGTITLTTSSPRYQSLDPDGSARNVDLPAAAAGLAFFIVNRGNGAEVITVRTSGAATVDTIDNDEGLSVICDGTRWISAKATLVIV